MAFLNNFSGKKHILLAGNRNCSEYGASVVRDIIGHLVANGAVLVSGVASGLDTVAQKVAIDCGGKSIGVLGYGAAYLRKDRYASNLAYEIIKSGNTLFSPFKSAQFPTIQTFIYRNLKMMEMSDCVLVVEATLEGGGMVIAQMAMKNEKPVFAIPGSVFSFASQGNHLLLRHGAHLVTTYQDILDILPKVD